jgi:hypothetical protein
MQADIPVRLRAQQAQQRRVFVHRLFALRAQADRMSALHQRSGADPIVKTSAGVVAEGF